MEKKFNISELFRDKKVKNIIVVVVALIAASLFLYFLFGNDKNPEEERNDKIVKVGEEDARLNFNVPNAALDSVEQSKMNMYNKGMEDSINLAKRTQEALSFSNGDTPLTTSSGNFDADGFSDSDFEAMRSSAIRSSNRNKHSTYGNGSMWSNKPASGSNVGYSDLGSVVEKPRAQAPSRSYNPPNQVATDEGSFVFEPERAPSYSYNNSQSAVPQNQIRNEQTISARLISKGYATNGRSLSFVLLEPFTYKGETIKKGQPIVGTAKIENNRIFVKFSSAKLNGKTVAVKGNVVGIDGDPGLPIANVEQDDFGDNVKDEVVSQSSRIPVVSGVVRTVQNLSTKRSANSNKIYLTENTKCTISLYE